jgi:hypothetical protein
MQPLWHSCACAVQVEVADLLPGLGLIPRCANEPYGQGHHDGINHISAESVGQFRDSSELLAYLL